MFYGFIPIDQMILKLIPWKIFNYDLEYIKSNLVTYIKY